MTTVTATPTTDPLAAYRASGTSGTDNGQDRFLTLLVTQMRNQDPLNPLDNAQVTSQLAQINTVKGIENMNSTLTDLGTRFDSLQVLQAASLVGREVLMSGTQLAVEETGARGAFELAGAADSVEVNVLDSAGKVVRHTTLTNQTAGMHDYKWDGVLDAGGKAAVGGTYTLQVTATQGTASVAASTFTATRVNSLTRGADGFALSLANGATAGMADIRRIY